MQGAGAAARLRLMRISPPLVFFIICSNYGKIMSVKVMILVIYYGSSAFLQMIDQD